MVCNRLWFVPASVLSRPRRDVRDADALVTLPALRFMEFYLLPGFTRISFFCYESLFSSVVCLSGGNIFGLEFVNSFFGFIFYFYKSFLPNNMLEVKSDFTVEWWWNIIHSWWCARCIKQCKTLRQLSGQRLLELRLIITMKIRTDDFLLPTYG